MNIIPSQYNIINIYADQTLNKLALLHSKEDFKVSVSIFNQTGDCEKEIELSLYYFSYDLISNTFPIYTEGSPYYQLQDIQAAEQLIAPDEIAARSIKMVEQIKTFEVDFEQGQILLSHKVQRANIDKTGIQKDNYKYYTGCFFSVFNLQGNLVNNYKYAAIDGDLCSAAFFGPSEIISLLSHSHGYQGTKIFLWNFIKKCQYQIDILGNKTLLGEEYCSVYEYIIEPFFIQKQQRLLGFGIEGPTYGVEGIKVVDLSNLNEYILSHSMDFLRGEGGCNNLCINTSANHFAAIGGNNEHILWKEYELGQQKEATYTLEIAASLMQQDQPPGHFYEYKTFYLNDNKLCFILLHEIVIYNIALNHKEQTLQRDKDSLYAITKNTIYYILNDQFLCHQES